MKRSLITLLVVLSSIASAIADNRPKVVATASMIADMAQTIAGDLLEIECIVPVGGDPHLHEPTPRDAKLVSDADLILVNAMTFEGWLGKLIVNSGTNAIVDTVTRGVKAIRSLTYENAVDPHAWMDASNGLIYVKNIYEALVELDPENKDIYLFNYEIYKSQLEELDRYIQEKINSLPAKRRILVTSHDAFQYYGKRYGLQLEALLGISTDADIQTRDIMRISKVISDNQIPAIFTESTINPKVLNQLARDQAIAIGGKLFSDSIGDEDSDAPSYLAMLKYNTDTIVEALSKESGSNGIVRTVSLTWLVIVPVVLLLGIVLLIIDRSNHRS